MKEFFFIELLNRKMIFKRNHFHILIHTAIDHDAFIQNVLHIIDFVIFHTFNGKILFWKLKIANKC